MATGRRSRPLPQNRRRSGAPTPRQQNLVERYRSLLIAGVIILLLIAGGVYVAVKIGPSNQGKEAAAGAAPVDPAVLAAVTQIPATTFDTVAAGSAGNAPKATGGSPIQASGKPELLYVGAEYCPYCAAERWALVAALSRLGSFSNLQTVQSSSTDAFPNTPTFTFYGSSYTSPYLTFTPVEQYTNQPSGSGYTSLQSLTSDQQAQMSKYNSQGGIPFVDFNGQYTFSGATYNPGVLSGMNWGQIAAQLSNPSSAQAQGIIGSANLITATICQTTGHQPADVCNSSGVQKAASLIGK